MTTHMSSLREFFIVRKAHHAFRQPDQDVYALARRFAAEGASPLERSVRRHLHVLRSEKPVVFPEERIAFMRTVTKLPELYTPEEMEALRAKHWLHEQGEVCNINVDYTMLMCCGFDAKRSQLLELAAAREAAGEAEAARYLRAQESILAAAQALADAYAREAQAVGNRTVADVLSHVPAKAPRSFLEALQMLRILHYVMWCGHNYHNTVGRFDQYMYPWFAKDLEAGVYNEETALELLEEFFLTVNRDSDLYTGMQQGDNGQSMVLGGLNPDGTDSYNLLSELCLKASLELKLIDPKINLRVHKDTPMSAYILGSELTKQGLGFPQYSNDDVVIPGLMDLGYSREDAHNYVVAACWEFIIPGRAMDIPNIGAVSLARAVTEAVLEDLTACPDYASFCDKVKEKIVRQADAVQEQVKNLFVFPAPYVSLMMEGCVEQARDVSLGCVYNNYGLHGTGVATAADSLEVIDRYVYGDGSITPERLVRCLQTDFEGEDELLTKLRYHTPKMGNHEDCVDDRAVWLLDTFADALEGRRNERGGIFRAGTGSAMYYVWHPQDLPASPDGRRAREALGANYSPSLFMRAKGPVSILHSFARPNLRRVINGGPLTIELHDTVFRNAEAVAKVAALVRSYMLMGGHQLQLNAVNRQTLEDAQRHPENYRNLIVRVWGWSGYFVELDKVYQDHIMQRMELAL
ncbi:MAG: pyruvate formate-lyase [Clostridia bacterium]|nr:pyruvate formate-lyase [Clostridia bacterium]